MLFALYITIFSISEHYSGIRALTFAQIWVANKSMEDLIMSA